MRVLVTGGGGFLGRAIIARLVEHGHAVRVFNRRPPVAGVTATAGWRQGDIVDAEAVMSAAEGCDTIVHLVGMMTPACAADPLLGAAVNVLGTLHVFEAAKRHGMRKVIYTSSGGVYAPDNDRVPVPPTHYGAFKLANEGSGRAYWLDHRIASIGFRPFIVYGPGREIGGTAGFSIACRAAAEGRPYTIPVTGPAGLVHSDDVALAYRAAVERDLEGAHTINLRGHVSSAEEVVAILRRLVPGAQVDCAGPPIPASATAPDEWSSPLLGLPPQRSLEAGLRETVEHHRRQRA